MLQNCTFDFRVHPKIGSADLPVGCPVGLLTHRFLPQQLPNNPRRGLQRRINLRLIFAAGFGNLRLSAA